MRKKDAVKHFGGVPALAKALGITRQAVHEWDRRVPALRAYQIEAITNGALKAIRPAQSD